MSLEKEYKLQGNGKHSWKVTTKDDNGNVTKVEMLYSDDPDFDPTDTTEKTVKLNPYQLHKLKELLK